jgi:2,3-bisphosphoglycerate-independent phosphoglycerate mutase
MMHTHENPKQFSSLAEAVKDSYKNGQEDESLEPIVIVDEKGVPLGRFEDGDSVIFYDIRGEREIELTMSLTDENFAEFPVKKSMRLHFTTMIEYHKDLKVDVAFPPQKEVTDTFCHVLSQNNKRYVKIVESEKAVHLGFFFNGKSKEPLQNEERCFIPSKKIEKPDEDPEMQIAEVVKTIITKIHDETADVIIANLANVDVVGHTENKEAILRAIEAVDSSLGEIIDEAGRQELTTIVTADHGTVEKWLYPEGTIDTGHTSSPIPFFIVEPDEAVNKKIQLRNNGELADVTPTVFDILGVDKPKAITGESLLFENPYQEKSRKRLLLVILDGWGESDDTQGNLIYSAKTPVTDGLKKNFPWVRLKASGEAVGMPEGTVGNSEAGHLHLGAGRRILSDRLRIDEAIAYGSYYENQAFLDTMQKAKTSQKNLHLLGIVSFYSSHGSLEHLKSLLRMANKLEVPKVYVHSILGRRGEKPESGANYIREIEELTKNLNTGSVVTVIGRHWVLDREENWDRIEKAYNTLVFGQGEGVNII